MTHTLKIHQSEDGILLLESQREIARRIANTGAVEVEVRVVDPRDVSREQQKKAGAILCDISRWSCGLASDKDILHEHFKTEFCALNAIPNFSLSKCDMTTARLYITHLIDFCIHNGVPTKRPLYAFCDDLEAMTYSCLAERKCAVHNTPRADVHHLTGSRVGMGRDRKTIIHEGLVCLPLCRNCHNECHLSEIGFLKKHHLEGIPLDKWLCQKLGLKTEAD